MPDHRDVRRLEYRNPYHEPAAPSVWQVLAGLVWSVLFLFAALMLAVTTMTIFSWLTDPMQPADRLFAVIVSAGAFGAVAFAAVRIFQITARQFKPRPREGDWE